MKFSLKAISRQSFLTLSGLALLLICLIPVTSVEEVINTSFTVSPGTKYGPNDPKTSYHTHLFAKSVLRGEVIVEGEGIYLTVNFYNTEHLNNIYVKGQYSFTVDPADDLYVFIFDNTEGHSESSVKFRLEEIWTRPLAIGSPPGFIAGLIGFFLFLTGLVTLAINRFKKDRRIISLFKSRLLTFLNFALQLLHNIKNFTLTTLPTSFTGFLHLSQKWFMSITHLRGSGVPVAQDR